MCDHVCPAAVCAEAYNPDDDDDNDTEPRVVHPKTDEQRRRLQDACKHILLFKTLDQVQQRRIYDLVMKRKIESFPYHLFTLIMEHLINIEPNLCVIY